MLKMKITFFLSALAGLAPAAAFAQAGDAPLKPVFQVTSPDYVEGAFLDKRSAASERDCGGKNLSPALQWAGEPATTKSFAVYFQDPDGMKAQGEAKWLGYNIPPDIHSMAEGAMSDKTPGMSIGQNDHGDIAYYGPCTPYGERHHYIYGVYALDLPVGSLKPGMTKTEFLHAINGHVVANNSISFVYQRRIPANGVRQDYVPKNRRPPQAGAAAPASQPAPSATPQP